MEIVRRNPARPVWEGRRCPFVSFRDLSLTRDADVWAEMSKVTFEVLVRVDNVICRTEAEVELTDTACQVDLIPGVGGVGFSVGGVADQRRESAERPPESTGQASPSCRTCS